MIQFEAPCSSFLPLRALLRTIRATTKVQKGKADVRLTLFKGADGQPDMLRFESFQSLCYGLVEITDGVTVLDGHREHLRLNSEALTALPEIENQDVLLKFSARQETDGATFGDLLVTYPDLDGLTEVQFSLYTDLKPTTMGNPWTFPETVGVVHKEDLEQLRSFLEVAKKTSPVVYVQTEPDGATRLAATSGCSCLTGRHVIHSLTSAGLHHAFELSSWIATLNLVQAVGSLEIGLGHEDLFLKQGTHLYLLLNKVMKPEQNDDNTAAITIIRKCFETCILSLESENLNLALIAKFNPSKLIKLFTKIDQKMKSHYAPPLILEPEAENIKLSIHLADRMASEITTESPDIQAKWHQQGQIKLNIEEFRNAMTISCKLNLNHLCYFLNQDASPFMAFTDEDLSYTYIISPYGEDDN